MPSIAENIAQWNSYEWSKRGDEWSEPWGSADREWEITILPRIGASLRGSSYVLEIAPGMGRWTERLLPLCKRLIAVDVSHKAIAGLGNRISRKFSPEDAYRLNIFHGDGKSLPVEDRSIDFVFSFDSLVHADADVLDAYLLECARVLNKDRGVGFIHHANRNTRYWRGSATADSVLEGCKKAGLYCYAQELTPWIHEQDDLLDCFTSFGMQPRVTMNLRVVTDLTKETAHAKRLVGLYG